VVEGAPGAYGPDGEVEEIPGPWRKVTSAGQDGDDDWPTVTVYDLAAEVMTPEPGGSMEDVERWRVRMNERAIAEAVRRECAEELREVVRRLRSESDLQPEIEDLADRWASTPGRVPDE
jgi:hypothetical protein